MQEPYLNNSRESKESSPTVNAANEIFVRGFLARGICPRDRARGLAFTFPLFPAWFVPCMRAGG